LQPATIEVLKIALCITDLEVGGAERCLVELAGRLDRRRFRPIVYCLSRPPEPGDDSLLLALKDADVEVHCLDARRSWQFPPLVRRLQHYLKSQNPHLLQTFLFHANIAGRVAARRAGVKFVSSGIRVAEQRHRWHLWVDRLTGRLVDRHVCVSRSVARFSETRARLPAEKLVVIPNGVDIQRFTARQPAEMVSLGIPAGCRLATYVGRLDRQKGLPWLIETAPVWLGRLPESRLLLVGKGPLRPRLERLCRLAGVSGRVHFAGWRRDVPEILAASDLLILPSAWEGMPNAVLEAMAAGLPVVATRVEGVEELLGSGAEMQTVGYGDSQALAEKVVRIIEDRETAAKLGVENRRRAQENFKLQCMVNAYEDLWESLVAG